MLSASLLLSLGCRGIAGHLTARYSANGFARFVPIYCAMLTVSFAVAVLYVGWPDWPEFTWKWSSAMLFSVLAGAGCAFLDRRVHHSAWTRRLRLERLPKHAVEPTERRARSGRVLVSVPLFTGRGVETTRTTTPTGARRKTSSSRQAFVVNAGVGCLEELVYRGAVLQVGLAAGSIPLYWTIATSSVLVFCVGHANFGIDHIYSKFPLALACMFLALWPGLTHHNSESGLAGEPCLLVKSTRLALIFATFR